MLVIHSMTNHNFDQKNYHQPSIVNTKNNVTNLSDVRKLEKVVS